MTLSPPIEAHKAALAQAIVAGDWRKAAELDPRVYADEGALYSDAEWRDAARYLLDSGDDGDLTPMLEAAQAHAEAPFWERYAAGCFDGGASHPDSGRGL